MNLQEVITRSVIETARNAFISSILKCPLKTGRLKASGNFWEFNIGGVIEYTAPYFAAVEYGTKGGPVRVESYIRKDGVRVKEHEKVMPAQPGKFFVTDSINESLQDFNSILERNLRTEYGDVKKIK